MKKFAKKYGKNLWQKFMESQKVQFHKFLP
jgi:hypothetical protein